MTGLSGVPMELDPAVEGCVREARSIARQAAFVLMLALLPAAAWLGFASLTSAVIASGVVKVDTSRQPIQHLQGGMAVEVRVHEGQAVQAGDVLFVMGDVNVDAERQRLQARVLSARASLARLDAERHAGSNLSWAAELVQAARQDPELHARLADERALFDSRRRALAEQADLLLTQQETLAREVAALRAQIASSEQALSLQRAELESNRRMQGDGFVSGNRVLQLESTLAEYSAGLESRRGDLARAQQRAIENELRQRVLFDEFRQRAGDQHAALSVQLQELQQEYRKALDASERQTITAPIAGTVMGLRVQAPGALIPARETVAEIVPAAPRLLVEVNVPTQDIGRVALRQKAEVRFTAFRSPGTRPLVAEVVYVAPDRLPDSPSRGSAYAVHVVADAQALSAAREGGVEPRAGMTAQVFLQGETRSPLAYLLEPVVDLIRRAARER